MSALGTLLHIVVSQFYSYFTATLSILRSNAKLSFVYGEFSDESGT